MRRAGWVLGLAVCFAGCASSIEQQVREHNNDGLDLFRRGQYLPARQSFEAGLQLRPGDAGLLYNIGECYDRQNVPAQAEKFYNDCLQQDPNHAPCRHALAALLVRQGRSADAARMIDAWLAREPKRADPYALDGWLWDQKGDLPRAQARLHQALDLDPQNVYALSEMALLYEAMHRPDRAKVLYERVLAREPNRADIVERLNRLVSQGAQRPQPE
jgi:Tfp pilus assembly protein PilF